jgi:hypothetical protein
MGKISWKKDRGRTWTCATKRISQCHLPSADQETEEDIVLNSAPHKDRWDWGWFHDFLTK